MSKRVHDILKDWIVEEANNMVNSKGKPCYEKAYSGDKEAIFSGGPRSKFVSVSVRVPTR